jgi:hypothetical protein
MNAQIIPSLTERQTQILAQCFQLAISSDCLAMAVETLANDARTAGLEKQFSITVRLAREAAEHAAELQTLLWTEYRLEDPMPPVANDPQ